jgi:YD repeat-containing protein
MPNRLDRVTVRTPSGDVTLTWDARDALVEKLDVDSLRPVFSDFVNAGTSRPDHIGEAHADQVADVIEAIGESSPDWRVALEGGLFELQTVLRDEQP